MVRARKVAGLTQHALALRLKNPSRLSQNTKAASAGSTSWNSSPSPAPWAQIPLS
jgi:hypothetical protein